MNLKELLRQFEATQPLDKEELHAATLGITYVAMLEDTPIEISGVPMRDIYKALRRMHDRYLVLNRRSSADDDQEEDVSPHEEAKGHFHSRNGFSDEEAERINAAMGKVVEDYDAEVEASGVDTTTPEHEADYEREINKRVLTAIEALGIPGLKSGIIRSVKVRPGETTEDAARRIADAEPLSLSDVRKGEAA